MALIHDITNDTMVVKEHIVGNFEDLDTRVTALEIFQQDNTTTAGLSFGYHGGWIRNDNVVTSVPAGTVALTDDATNYIQVNPTTGAVTINTTGFTAGLIPLRRITVASGAVTVNDDVRTWASAGGSGGGATNLDALIDVAVTSPASAQYIRHNGSTWVNGSIQAGDLPSHTHTISNVTNLQSTLDAKAASSHTHGIADVTNLQSTLDAKATSTHTHNAADINAGTMNTARLGSGTADNTRYLRGDSTWQALPYNGGSVAGQDTLTASAVSGNATIYGNVVITPTMTAGQVEAAIKAAGTGRENITVTGGLTAN